MYNATDDVVQKQRLL